MRRKGQDCSGAAHQVGKVAGNARRYGDTNAAFGHRGSDLDEGHAEFPEYKKGGRTMKMRTGFCATILGLLLSLGDAHADADQNIQIMVEAARQLTLETWMGDNRANLLVKQETVIAPVAVIFSYISLILGKMAAH